MNKRQFRIGQLAKQLKVERFVVRFWEKEFNVQTTRSSGGQRFYQEQDLETFKKIKELLYEKKFTIAGAKEALRKNSAAHLIPSQKTEIKTTDMLYQNSQQIERILTDLVQLQKQLIKLRALL